jgi:hypothetical protein
VLGDLGRDAPEDVVLEVRFAARPEHDEVIFALRPPRSDEVRVDHVKQAELALRVH